MEYKQRQTEFESLFLKYYKKVAKRVLYPTILSALAINAGTFSAVIYEMSGNSPLKVEQIEEKLSQETEKSLLIKTIVTIGRPGIEIAYISL